MILRFFFIPSIFNIFRRLAKSAQSLKGKEPSKFPNSNMSLNERFQMKTAMSYANAADIASYSQIFSKLALCQGAMLRE